MSSTRLWLFSTASQENRQERLTNSHFVYSFFVTARKIIVFQDDTPQDVINEAADQVVASGKYHPFAQLSEHNASWGKSRGCVSRCLVGGEQLQLYERQ
jgi:hypothetical protein